MKHVNPGTLQFLLGRHLDRMGAATCNPNGESVYLDAELMWLSSLCYPLSESDNRAARAFKAAWRLLEAKEKPADVKQHLWDGQRRFSQISLYMKLAYDSNVLQKSSTPYDSADPEDEEELYATP